MTCIHIRVRDVGRFVWTDHHNDDHGASHHAGPPRPHWEVGFSHPRHRVWLHHRGHGCELWPRALLQEETVMRTFHRLARALMCCFLKGLPGQTHPETTDQRHSIYSQTNWRIDWPPPRRTPCSPSGEPGWPSFASSIPRSLWTTRTWKRWRRPFLGGRISIPTATPANRVWSESDFNSLQHLKRVARQENESKCHYPGHGADIRHVPGVTRVTEGTH